VTRWRGAAVRVLATLVVVAALPSSAAPPSSPPTDTALLVGRLEWLETAVRQQARETTEARADARALERRVAELEAERRGEQRDAGEEESWQSDEPRRRLQAPPARGDVVHIHRANVSLPTGPGWNTSPNYNGGHRRSLQGSGGQCGNMATRAQSVQARCCDDASEDCSGGYPHTCNAGCAAVFLPFWVECGSLLGNAAAYQQTVALCQQAQPASTGSSSLAHEFNLVCVNGAVGDCVPACSEALRGDLLLMNLNGEDSKYSCELHHGLHSWVGAATDGGYLGHDTYAFVSAVLSGAAGYYALSARQTNFTPPLIIGPGQRVHLTSEGPRLAWSGSIMVQDHGSLSASNIRLSGLVQQLPGGLCDLDNTVNRGIIYAIGSSSDLRQPVPQAYNPISNTWTAIGAMGTARVGLGAAALGGRIYAVGGDLGGNSLNTAEVYDPLQNVWTMVAPMAVERALLAVEVLGGQLYAIGGRTNTIAEVTNSAEAYDPVSNAWRVVAPMSSSRKLLAAAALGGRLYAVGGTTISLSQCLRSAEAYDPIHNTWTVIAPMSTGRCALAAAALGGQLYAVGGVGGPASHGATPTFATVEVYNPVHNAWTAIAPMGHACPDCAATVLEGQLYAFSGGGVVDNLGCTLNVDAEVYNPTQNVWEAIATMKPAYVCYFAVAVIV
jgi:hypothetical protein